MNWLLKPKVPEEFIKQFPEYPPIVLQLLWNREMKTQKLIDEFFNPDYDKDLHDPFLMLGMEKAIERVLKAIKNKEPIVIFGDYDADGVCGAAILYKTFMALGAKILKVYIPDRSSEGYGLNQKAIKELAQKGAKLIVSIDCGVTDIEEIRLANSLKIDVIVLDHHEIIERLPKAVAIVDAHQKNDRYPFKDLAAGGVAFKFIQGLLQKLRRSKSRIKILPTKGWEKWLLDLVAIATVADSVSLLGENRTLLKYGLVVLAQTNKPGLRELMRTAGLNPVVDIHNLETNLDGHTLGFILGPRLNAASRMDHANSAFNLLITESFEEARKIANELDQRNKDRQVLMEKIMSGIEKKLQKKDSLPPVIFEGSIDWPIGLIGLIAGRLTDRYQRPAIIYNIGQSFCKASARSIAKFDMIEALKKNSGLFIEFGGHPMSAGFSFRQKNSEAIKNSFQNLFKETINNLEMIPEIEIDSELAISDISFAMHDQIEKFAPFGEDNPMPVFLAKDFTVSGLKNVGNNGKHLKLELQSGSVANKVFKAIGFNQTAKNGHLAVGDKVDLVFELIVDQWNGTRNLQLKVLDIKKTV